MQQKGSKKLFDGQTIFVGIDVHKKNWTVGIFGERYEHKVFVQDPRPELLVNYLTRNFPGAEYRAVYEAGFSGFGACRELNQSAVNCIVIHPSDVPIIRKEKLQKNDKTDCRKLARSLRAQQLQGIYVPGEELEADRALVRQRYRIVRSLASTKNRVKSLLFQFGIDIPERFSQSQSRSWSKAYLNWLENLEIKDNSIRMVLDSYISTGKFHRKELLTKTKQIKLLMEKDCYKTDYQNLRSCPGLGLVSAATLLLEIGDIHRFKTLDQLNYFVGLVPKTFASGDKIQTGKLIRRGRKELKIILIEASWQAVRLDPVMMAKFNELSKKMNKNKAIIRIARKMLSRVKHILSTKEKYQYGIT